ncbi:unnamed protein product [Ambrosiozyma monospora]|uniref:Unnamed protein product n=1 Tax=Ambrosiozyma monospora TaxID=43982 RepID=A0ACB5T9I1_AMBMO|nr:unnamed protein product [Ambrosiozyma monospora]
MKLGAKLISTLFLLTTMANALSIKAGDVDSVCNATAQVIKGTLNYYGGLKNPAQVGVFYDPYYWWEAGEGWGGMIINWQFCKNNDTYGPNNNDTLESILYDALMSQRGSGNDYIPSSQSLTEGNDDQAFWGLAVLEAAERNFTNPPEKEPGWLALSQAVFNTMWARWDTENCGGGLRWQIFTWNKGYDYKNTISNSCLFHIGARLARYTSNDTYAETATTVYKWLLGSGFVVDNGR